MYTFRPAVGAITAALTVAGSLAWAVAQVNHPVAIAAASREIAGVVTSDDGPEAGVWLIAEKPSP